MLEQIRFPVRRDTRLIGVTVTRKALVRGSAPPAVRRGRAVRAVECVARGGCRHVDRPLRPVLRTPLQTGHAEVAVAEVLQVTREVAVLHERLDARERRRRRQLVRHLLCWWGMEGIGGYWGIGGTGEMEM